MPPNSSPQHHFPSDGQPAPKPNNSVPPISGTFLGTANTTHSQTSTSYPDPAPKKSPAAFFFKLLIAILFVLICMFAAVGAYIFWYKNDPIRTEVSTDAKIDSTPEVTTIVMSEFEYRHTPKTERTSTRVANTIRFQLYGPPKLSGYDINGNFVTKDAILDLCRGTCTGKEKLWFELFQQGVADEPLANISLENVQKEYDAYVQSGKVGMFYSSVISVPLPAKPPQSESYPGGIWSSSFIPYVFPDLNDNGIWDLREKSVGGSTDYLMFVRENKKRPGFVLGWNFAYASGDQEAATVANFKDDFLGLQEYRKSYDSVIFQIPVFSTKEPLFSRDLSKVSPCGVLDTGPCN